MSPVERWNAFAAEALEWAASSAVTSAMLFAVVTLLWLGLQRRVSAHLGHALFLVPLAPLVLPGLGTVELPAWGPSSGAGAELVLLEPFAAPFDAGPSESPVLEVEENASGPPAMPARAMNRAVAPTWQALVLLGWAVIVALLVLRLVAVQRRMHRSLTNAPDISGLEGERVRGRLARLMPVFGLRRPLRVVETDAVATPAVCGISRPVLALDRGLVANLDREQLDWVLSHELAHLARHDLARVALQRLVQVLWFFHPIVWLTARVADELRESACDETALALAGPSQRSRCARALIEVAAHGVRGSRRALLLSLHDDKTTMKKRIIRLLDPTRVPARRTPLFGLVLCGGLAGSSLVGVTFAQDDEVILIEEEPEEAFVEEVAYTREDVQLAVDRSLDWLLARQASDGHWPTGPSTDVDAGEFNSIGLTGFVLLALDESQREDPRHERAQAIERGRTFLASIQGEDGLFGTPEGFTFMQSHAVATLAWIRTRPERGEDWRPGAEHAVEVILAARNPYMGWRFDRVPTGDCDTFTTGLMLAALHEASKAGIEVPESAWIEPLDYIDQVTEPSNGRTGYDKRGGNDARLRDKRDAFPAELTQLSTAVAITTRMQWGEEPGSSRVIRRGAFLLSEFAPRWDEEAGSIDYYYWLFGTRALAPIGGAGYEHWRDALMEALLPHQLLDPTGGWWPAVDAWSAEETEVQSTALCTLALQAVI